LPQNEPIWVAQVSSRINTANRRNRCLHELAPELFGDGFGASVPALALISSCIRGDGSERSPSTTEQKAAPRDWNRRGHGRIRGI
jgi:hypothetical protein